MNVSITTSSSYPSLAFSKQNAKITDAISAFIPSLIQSIIALPTTGTSFYLSLCAFIESLFRTSTPYYEKVQHPQLQNRLLLLLQIPLGTLHHMLGILLFIPPIRAYVCNAFEPSLNRANHLLEVLFPFVFFPPQTHDPDVQLDRIDLTDTPIEAPTPTIQPYTLDLPQDTHFPLQAHKPLRTAQTPYPLIEAFYKQPLTPGPSLISNNLDNSKKDDKTVHSLANADPTPPSSVYTYPPPKPVSIQFQNLSPRRLNKRKLKTIYPLTDHQHVIYAETAHLNRGHRRRRLCAIHSDNTVDTRWIPIHQDTLTVVHYQTYF